MTGCIRGDLILISCISLFVLWKYDETKSRTGDPIDELRVDSLNPIRSDRVLLDYLSFLSDLPFDSLSTERDVTSCWVLFRLRFCSSIQSLSTELSIYLLYLQSISIDFLNFLYRFWYLIFTYIFISTSST